MSQTPVCCCVAMLLCCCVTVLFRCHVRRSAAMILLCCCCCVAMLSCCVAVLHKEGSVAVFVCVCGVALSSSFHNRPYYPFGQIANQFSICQAH